eukprot:scaffold3229_cov73-Isochrysis_galbana.AAC.1
MAAAAHPPVSAPVPGAPPVPARVPGPPPVSTPVPGPPPVSAPVPGPPPVSAGRAAPRAAFPCVLHWLSTPRLPSRARSRYSAAITPASRSLAAVEMS